MTELQKKLSAMVSGVEIAFEEPMAKHTSLRIGGGAEAYGNPRTQAGAPGTHARPYPSA